MSEMERELGWDDEIEKDSGELSCFRKETTILR